MRSEFGERLLQARTAAGLTQAQAAKGIMSQSTLAELERNGQGSAHTPALAARYNVRPEWLATGQGPKKSGADFEEAVAQTLANAGFDVERDVTLSGDELPPWATNSSNGEYHADLVVFLSDGRQVIIEVKATTSGNSAEHAQLEDIQMKYPERYMFITSGTTDFLQVAVDRLRSLENPGYRPRMRAAVNLAGNADYPQVRRVAFKLSAGASGFGVDYLDDDEAPIVFKSSWFKANNYQPERLFAVRVMNSSMEPGLYDGDTVVVNTADAEPKDGIVFALNYEGEMVIKRLFRDDGQWWLTSDNPDQRRYPRKVFSENTFIIGRVVHKQSERV